MCSSDDELERTANSIAALKCQMDLARQNHESQKTGCDMDMVELQTIYWVRERRAKKDRLRVENSRASELRL